MTVIRNILLFVILLSTIVSLHELGHLIAAKIFNVYCKEYSIGMGPKICSFKGKETEYSLRALPLGGFVAMAGDTDNSLETQVDPTDLPPERTLTGIAKWKRVIIMMAGIFMNIMLAIVIYSLVILGNGAYANSTKPVVTQIVADSPAEKAGLQVDDVVVGIGFDNGLKIKPSTYLELTNFLSAYDGNGSWTVSVERNGEIIDIKVEPAYNEEQERYMMGVGFSDKAIEYVETNIFNCWKYGFEYTIFIVKVIWSSFISLFQGKNLDSLSGPVGIYTTVSQSADLGFSNYMQLMAIISVNVGIVNALPLPIFDGGRVLLLLIEMIIGKPLSEKTQNLVMNISMGLLLILFVFVMYNDISRLIGG